MLVESLKGNRCCQIRLTGSTFRSFSLTRVIRNHFVHRSHHELEKNNEFLVVIRRNV